MASRREFIKNVALGMAAAAAGPTVGLDIEPISLTPDQKIEAMLELVQEIKMVYYSRIGVVGNSFTNHGYAIGHDPYKTDGEGSTTIYRLPHSGPL